MTMGSEGPTRRPRKQPLTPKAEAIVSEPVFVQQKARGTSYGMWIVSIVLVGTIGAFAGLVVNAQLMFNDLMAAKADIANVKASLVSIRSAIDAQELERVNVEQLKADMVALKAIDRLVTLKPEMDAKDATELARHERDIHRIFTILGKPRERP